MLSHRKLLIFVTVVVLLCSHAARSQEPNAVRGLDESAAKAVRTKAIDLLESVAGQISSLRSAENRARIGSNVAELLWSHDEKRARSLFAAVEEDIKAGFYNSDSDESARSQTLMVFIHLRSDTVRRIARHDPELALEFLQATRPASDLQLPDYAKDGEKSLELRLASQIAAKNPQSALKLARQSLTKGFSPDLLPVLSQLQAKDKDAWLSLYREIVDKLNGENLAHDSLAAQTALALAQSFPPSGPDEQVDRDLIGLLLTNALASGCGPVSSDGATPQICFQIASLFSRMEMYYGARAAPLRRYAADTEGRFAPRVSPLVREVMEYGTVDEILALIVKHPEVGLQAYWRAMVKAQASGDVARARQIASDFPDEEQRRYMLAQIDRNQMWRTVNPEKLAAIQQELGRLRTDQERIQFLLYRANQIGGNDRKAALGLLNQASQIIDSARPGGKQLGYQLKLAMMYCSVKSDRGFAIMESLIPRFNELVTAASVLDGFDTDYLRDGEWNMSGDGSVGEILNSLADNAGYFAKMDFDRSVTLARQF